MGEVDVRATVLFAGHCDYELTTRSGGHNYIGPFLQPKITRTLIILLTIHTAILVTRTVYYQLYLYGYRGNECQ